MRSVFRKRLRGAALLALVMMMLAVPALYADDLDPNQPPEAIIRPPGGVASQTIIRPSIGLLDVLFIVWQMA